MVLEGKSDTYPKSLPIIFPELQNRSVISIYCGSFHSGALTSSGKLLTWGLGFHGDLGLGDPGKLPVGSPGGYENEERVGKVEWLPYVRVPSEVRFDHGLKAEGRVERYCFAAASGFMHTTALVIDFAGDEVPPEDLEQHFETTMSLEKSNNTDRS